MPTQLNCALYICAKRAAPTLFDAVILASSSNPFDVLSTYVIKSFDDTALQLATARSCRQGFEPMQLFHDLRQIMLIDLLHW